MRIFNGVILSIIALLVLAGCSSGGGSETSGSAPKTPFLGGNDGIDIELLEGSPPEEVTDGGTLPFQAVVMLKNEGEFDLKRDDVKVDLIGILPEDFGVSSGDLTDKRPEDDLSPKIRDGEGNIVDPIVTEVAFPDSDNFFNFERSVTGNTVFVFRADICYKYQTKALSRICVLRDLINLDKDDICDPSDTKKVFSSASPVQVNSFKQTVAGRDKISFSFDVSHTGSGDVFKEGDSTSPPADCPKDSRARREKENKVFVSVDTGLSSLRCIGFGESASGYVTLVNGKRTVTCHQELDSGRNDFETNVDITLDFNYRDNVEREVLVKHLLDS
jgi:hypothetical protein|tara:strand:- start:1242 stop:2234 length:993 start_codon:yes stop_codon:yes gene_type:complete